MFDCLATLTHGPRVLVEALLYCLHHSLMLPSRDPTLLAGGTAILERAMAARIRSTGLPIGKASVMSIPRAYSGTPLWMDSFYFRFNWAPERFSAKRNLQFEGLPGFV